MAGVADSPPASYGRAVAAPAGGRWLQYWRWHESNGQDRGVLRTGRHAGDWELVQVRVDRGEQPVEAVYAQHSGGERCGWPEVRTRGDAPVAYLANGSHAAYFRARCARPHVPRSQRRGARARQRDPPAAGGDRRGLAELDALHRALGREPRTAAVRAVEPARARLPGRALARPGGVRRVGAELHGGALRRIGECDWRESVLGGGALSAIGLLAGVVVWRRRRLV